MNIDQELFFKFFSREASVEETDALTAWLDEDPSRQEEFNKAYEMFMISQVVAFADLDSRPAAGRKQV